MPASPKRRSRPPRKRAAKAKPPAARGQTAPRVAVRDAGVAPVARSLQRTAAQLQYAQESFADALLRLPRAEEFEPLIAPLREFARISPALIEALRGVMDSARALGAAVAKLESGPARSEQALRCIETALDAVQSALAQLPEEPDYAPAASRLRELATVSPSLMAWLQEVPALAAPLRGSVQALGRAAEDLDRARALLRGQSVERD